LNVQAGLRSGLVGDLNDNTAEEEEEEEEEIDDDVRLESLLDNS